MKFTEYPPERQERIRENILRHTDFLCANSVANSDLARKYLTLTNGIGIVAILAYLSTQDSARVSPIVWWSLSLFISGVLLAGVVTAVMYLSSQRMLLVWIEDSARVFHNEIELESLATNLHRLAKPKVNIADMAGWASFLAFVAGMALAVIKVGIFH